MLAAEPSCAFRFWRTAAQPPQRQDCVGARVRHARVLHLHLFGRLGGAAAQLRGVSDASPRREAQGTGAQVHRYVRHYPCAWCRRGVLLRARAQAARGPGAQQRGARHAAQHLQGEGRGGKPGRRGSAGSLQGAAALVMPRIVRRGPSGAAALASTLRSNTRRVSRRASRHVAGGQGDGTGGARRPGAGQVGQVAARHVRQDGRKVRVLQAPGRRLEVRGALHVTWPLPAGPASIFSPARIERARQNSPCECP